jgi:drug/metabolite transporter (DMT)-like permease
MSPIAALILDVFITALWPLIGAAGLAYYSTTPFMTAGLVIGFASMTPWLARGGRARRMFSREAAPSLAVMGFFSGAASLVYIAALAYTTPVNAVILAQSEVVYSAVLSAIFLGERPTLKQSLASALVIGGTALIVLHDLRSPRWRGDLMILASPWMYQISHVFSKKLPHDLDAWTLSGGRALYGLLFMLPLCAWTMAYGGRWSWSAAPIGMLILQGLLCCSANLVLWYVALRGLELSKATTIMLSYPALTLVFAWLLGRETIRAVQVLGLATTFAGAAWTARLSAGTGRELITEV